MVSFWQLAGAKDDETVVFAWMVFESRTSRDEVNAKVLADPRLKDMCEKGQMPLNYKRMAYGGFCNSHRSVNGGSNLRHLCLPEGDAWLDRRQVSM